MGELSLLVSILCVFFGIGTWACVNGLWVELPLLVQRLPEQWKLPSFITVVIQISNLGPLTYISLHKLFPTVVTEKRSTYFVMTLGSLSLILLSYFWDHTTQIFGSQHSLIFLVLVFFLASVDCSSRVLYLPFMAKFKSMYLTPYFIGEGMSSFIPSIFALIQGVGGNPECQNSTVNDNSTVTIPQPNFSVENFFTILLILTILSGIAFFLLNCETITKSSIAVKQDQNPIVEPTSQELLISASAADAPLGATYQSNELTTQDSSVDQELRTTGMAYYAQPASIPDEYVLLLVTLAVISALSNGIFPSIQSYSCLPYGNVAYHWTVTLSSMANPGICFVLLYVKSVTKTNVFWACLLSFVVGIYVMITAVMSPTPPMRDLISGQLLLVSTWVLLVALFTFVKVSIIMMLRDRGKRGLFWSGALTQAGSTAGSIVAFVLVNYADIFRGYNPCV